MADGPAIETFGQSVNSAAPSVPPSVRPEPQDRALKRALLLIAIAASSAGLAFAIVRTTLTRPPADPTTERIQQLIDEANRLLKALDDKKPE